MKIIRVTCFALGAFVLATSCSKEAAGPDDYEWTDGEIYFKTSLSDLTPSRATDMTLDHLESFRVTCFNTGDIKKDAEGFITPYFEDATFVREDKANGVTFVSAPDQEPYDWPKKSGVLKFYAFSPSCATMAAGNTAIPKADSNNYFKLQNRSTEPDAIDYRLEKVRVNPDISSQFDFITSEVSGERWKDFGAGVNLAFRHQMCQVELKAWGASTTYNFEIAGVRLGNPVVEGTFVFSDAESPTSPAAWMPTDNALKDKVEYLFRGAEAATNTGLPESGDMVFRINPNEHNTLETAESIMGIGGCAMVLPTRNSKWEGLNDPNIGIASYSTDKMYFSVLLRVIDQAKGKTLFPYPKNPYGMTMLYYAVDENGKIVSRLYPGRTEGEFFTDSSLLRRYIAAEGEEIKDFCWAAIPVDVDWNAGRRYVYTLNYSEGVGVHDPEDPEPGKPILNTTPISWGVSIVDWEYAVENDDYKSDLIVP